MEHLKEPDKCINIQEVRNAIDVLDREILELFARRLEYIKEIVKFKKSDENSIIAQERKELVLKERKFWAEELNLDIAMIEQIFTLLIDKNIEIQIKLSNSERNK